MSEKVSVKVEIPDGWELACEEMRVPREGENYLACGAVAPPPNGTSLFPRVIVRRKWTWPAWLKARWLFCDRSGAWIANSGAERPRSGDGFWYFNWGAQTASVCEELFDFTPPPCDDWRLSLRENPALSYDRFKF